MVALVWVCRRFIFAERFGFVFSIRAISNQERDFPGHDSKFGAMSNKSAKIAALIDSCRGQDLDAHYLGYFACFNQGLFYESHDVLEELWLAHRDGPNYSFHKGLIQFAGAFVHLQKNRLRPAAALFKLGHANLAKYPPIHDHLDIANVLQMIEHWLRRLETADFAVNPLTPDNAPKLHLLPRG